MSKEEQKENLLMLPSLENSVAHSLDTPFFNLGDWPEKKWWEVFESAELNALIEQALHSNPSIQSVKEQISFAEQRATVVRSRLFPLIFFNAEETWQFLSHNGLYRAFNPTIPINANLVDLSLSLNYEFDFWGKNRNLFLSALGRAKAAAAESAQVELITSTSVAQAYFALKSNLVRQKLYNRLFEVRQNIFELQELLVENALYSMLPPLLAEEDLWEAQKFVLSIQEEVAINRHLINALIGVGPDAPLEIAADLSEWDKNITVPATLSLDLLARRPDMMAQIWRAESLAHEVGAAKADFYPDINLKAFIGLESIFYHKLFDGQSKMGGVEPALHLPIFTAGAIRANVRAKKAEFDRAVFDYNQLLLQGTQEVADVLSFAESVFAQKKKQEDIVENAEMRLELSLLRTESGLDNFLENYAKEEELIAKQLEDVTLLYSQYLAIVKLNKALGGGYQSEYLPLRAAGEER